MSRSFQGGETWVVAHDYFTQRGGAERVAAALVTSISPREVITAAYNIGQTFDLPKSARLLTSFIQKIPPLRRDPRRALLLLPIAWRMFRPVSADILLCSSSGWSHALRAAPGTIKVIYCHNPARWIYQQEDYFADYGPLVRFIIRIITPLLKIWDQRSARSADLYIANSTAVARRVYEAYGLRATVVHPPVSLPENGPQEAIKLPINKFFLTVGRGRGYKNLELLVAAFSALRDHHLVVVGPAPENAMNTKNVTYIQGISDPQLTWLYAHAEALLSVSNEDFGLTPLEANLQGTPALVVRAGGFLDSIRPGLNGLFIEELTVKGVAAAVRNFPPAWDADAMRCYARQFALEAFLKKLSEQLSQHLLAGTTDD